MYILKSWELNELESSYLKTNYIIDIIQVTEGRKYVPQGPYVGQPYSQV
jgi:hypothetical protein